MEIKKAEFVKSSAEIEQCPEEGLPEYAFIGRSNTGKSSLINMLTNKKELAKISGKPGKTRLVNHFLIDKNWYLVDLPGYGYAKVSKSAREDFDKLIKTYIKKRKEMICLFVLIDSRHKPLKNDLEFMEWLGVNGIPFVIAFTKADKLSSSQLNQNMIEYKTEMMKSWEEMPQTFITSAVSGLGKMEILNYIDHINTNLVVNIGNQYFLRLKSTTLISC